MNRKAIHLQDSGTSIRIAQGYEATTTLQIAKEVGVTEPAVFYSLQEQERVCFPLSLKRHPRSISIASTLWSLMLQQPSKSLAALIRIHFSIVVENPEFMRILLRTCPVRVWKTLTSTCTKVYREARSKLKTILEKILEKGEASGEFVRVDINATSNMLIAMFNGIMRQQIAGLDGLNDVGRATIEFCKNALVVKN